MDRTPAAAGRRRNNEGGVVWRAEDYDAFMAASQESYRRIRAFADEQANAWNKAKQRSRPS